MPTIKDVAREAGVSIATVSYVLNNKGDSISAPTRALVLETATRIGYTPNVTARNLRFSRTGLIGYAWHEAPSNTMNTVLDQFIYHLAFAAEAEGYHLLTFTHPTDDPTPVYDELIRTRRVDAFILAGTQEHDPRIELLQERNFPFACFGRSQTDRPFTYVDVNAEQGVHDAVSYFVELGHKRIAMVAWDHKTYSTSLIRVRAFQQAMQTHGLSADLVYYGEHSEDTGRKALQQWVQLPSDEQPTAVFAISDLEAIGLMSEAQEHGIQVGEQLSIIGFDDMPLSQHLRPALTTVRQPIKQSAEAVMENLMALLANSDDIPEPVMLMPELVKRKSCHAIP